MKAVNFDVRQRINVTLLLGMQRGTVQDVVTLSAIISKIALSEDDKKKINYRVGDSDLVRWDPETAAGIATIGVNLEEEEVRRLCKMLNDCQSFSTSDIEWVVPLIRALA